MGRWGIESCIWAEMGNENEEQLVRNSAKTHAALQGSSPKTGTTNCCVEAGFHEETKEVPRKAPQLRSGLFPTCVPTDAARIIRTGNNKTVRVEYGDVVYT